MSSEQYARLVEMTEEFESFEGSEQRVEPRWSTPRIPVDVQPLDDQLNPEGDQFQAWVRNISESGIGMEYKEPISAPYLAIELVSPSEERIKIVAETRHCTPMGVLIGVRVLNGRDSH